jgi:hypothetical protein
MISQEPGVSARQTIPTPRPSVDREALRASAREDSSPLPTPRAHDLEAEAEAEADAETTSSRGQ